MKNRNFKSGRGAWIRLARIALIAASATASATASAAADLAGDPAGSGGGAVFPSAYERPDGSLQGAWFAQKAKVSAFDPFVDYNEFQDNESERENVVFLKSGRLLSLGVFGGYEGITWTMREIYGDSLSVFGGFINFFFDLQTALQLHIIFPRTHYFSPLRSRPRFSNFGIDFKYYFKKQNLVKGIAVLNPYAVCGFFLMKASRFLLESSEEEPPASNSVQRPVGETAGGTTGGGAQTGNGLTQQEKENISSESSTGFRLGAGVEIPVFKQVFAGLEINYSYVPLPFQNRDLSQISKFNFSKPSDHKPQRSFLQKAVEPDPPVATGIDQRRFVGDMVSVFMTLGVNF